MSVKRRWMVLGGLSAIAIVLTSLGGQWSAGLLPRWGEVAIAQAPVAAPRTAPVVPPSPGGVATPQPPTVPAPATPGSIVPAPLPNQTTIPSLPVSPSLVSPPPAAPASTATPSPLGETYQDSAGRFKVGVLKGFKVTPLAGTVLIESPDGNLAYSVVTQSQPLGTPIGVSAGYDNSESLAKVARSVFQRGEGFQPGPPRLEAGGGAVMDWTGSLTIASTPQPVGGTILVRPSSRHILLLIITATQAGAEQVPGALSALSESLQSL